MKTPGRYPSRTVLSNLPLKAGANELLIGVGNDFSDGELLRDWMITEVKLE
jgi:hypothetical protein